MLRRITNLLILYNIFISNSSYNTPESKPLSINRLTQTSDLTCQLLEANIPYQLQTNPIILTSAYARHV